MDIKDKFKHLKSDQIGDGIYIAFEWSNKRLSRIYIGSKTNGPMLEQYIPDPNYADTISGIEFFGQNTIIQGYGYLYNGKESIKFPDGAWTNCYSRGNFVKKYAFGGNWSGHVKNKHPRIADGWKPKDKTSEILTVGKSAIELPKGIQGDSQMTDMDCSGAWSIWFTTAKEALANRLSRLEISESTLPTIFKDHLLKNETDDVLQKLNEVIETYEL